MEILMSLLFSGIVQNIWAPSVKGLGDILNMEVIFWEIVGRMEVMPPERGLKCMVSAPNSQAPRSGALPSKSSMIFGSAMPASMAGEPAFKVKSGGALPTIFLQELGGEDGGGVSKVSVTES